MSVLLPNAARVYPSLWVSPRGDRRFGTRLSPWSLLRRLLLGGDGALVCRRRHESLLDRCPFGIGVGRKGGAVWSPCAATCRDRLYSGRSLVADPECLSQGPVLTLSRHSNSACECPLLAQSGHGHPSAQCPLSGVKRTSHQHAGMSAYDPKRTWALIVTRRPVAKCYALS